MQFWLPVTVFDELVSNVAISVYFNFGKTYTSNIWQFNNFQDKGFVLQGSGYLSAGHKCFQLCLGAATRSSLNSHGGTNFWNAGSLGADFGCSDLLPVVKVCNSRPSADRG